MTRVIPFVACLFMACGGGSAGGTGAKNPCNACNANVCTGNACAGKKEGAIDASAGGDYSGWKSWTKINDKPFLSKGHKGKTVDVYVKPEFADQYPKTNPAPVGMQVAKVIYTDASASAIAKVMVMTKMKAGYDTDDDDWFYAVFDETGTKASAAGALDGCKNCHGGAEYDYLGGVPGMH